MGMTAEQFWDGDYEFARHYRKAFELQKERNNEAAWMQALYIRDAIANVLLGDRKAKYPSEPYPLNTSISQKRSKERQREIERENMLLEREKFLQWAKKFNQRFEQKQETERKEAGSVE